MKEYGDEMYIYAMSLDDEDSDEDEEEADPETEKPSPDENHQDGIGEAGEKLVMRALGSEIMYNEKEIL